MTIKLVLLVLAALVLSACQPTGVPTPPTATLTPVSEAYPQPGAAVEVIPEQRQYTLPEQDLGPYPGPGQGEQIAWMDAAYIILRGEVAQLAQTHSREVTLTLKDGRFFNTIEPEIDEILKVIESCGEPCNDIIIATE